MGTAPFPSAGGSGTVLAGVPGALKTQYVDGRDFDVGTGDLHFALRETRAHLARPAVLTGLAGMAILLGLAGPFGTLAVMGLPLRLAYWAAVVLGSYGIGAVVSILLERRAMRRGWTSAARLALTTLGIAGPVALMVMGLNLALFGHLPSGATEVLAFLGTVTLAAGVITLTGHFMERDGDPQPGLPPGPPPLLDRLSPARRGTLLSLSVSDHYVEVVTEAGREMILMRLGDAIREAGEGVQIHRSHWVARGAIADVTRAGDGARVTLSDGRTLPASRARLPDLRKLGWLGGRA